ncbi:MAG: formate dehydrogenase accessory sulfurtransferase FdhD [Pseudomonadota bacterium]
MGEQMADVAAAVVQELAEHDAPISSARLCKTLGIRMSTLLRCLAYVGDAEIAGKPGLGWVDRREDGERLLLSLSASGRAALEAGALQTPVPPAPVPMPAVTQQQAVLRYRDGVVQAAQDALAEETPIALVYNGISHAVMMATPADLEAFATGFSLSEGIVDSVAQVYDVSCHPQQVGIEMRLTISGGQFSKLKGRRRQLAGRTGCGLCGLESLQALDLDMLPLDHALRLRRSDLVAAMASLPRYQELNALTGALHIAAWADARGQVQQAMEDVGRHNALDKLVGALAHDKVDSRAGWVLMSSRASYELVQKCARAGISLLATVSAPTALAVRLAEQAGICLVGFVRESGLVVYSFPERILAD